MLDSTILRRIFTGKTLINKQIVWRIECTELPKFKRGVKEVFQRMNGSNLYRKNFVQQTKQSATHTKLRTMPMVIDSIDSFVT